MQTITHEIEVSIVIHELNILVSYGNREYIKNGNKMLIEYGYDRVNLEC